MCLWEVEQGTGLKSAGWRGCHSFGCTKCFLGDTTFREGGAYFGIQKLLFGYKKLFWGYKKTFFGTQKTFVRIL